MIQIQNKKNIDDASNEAQAYLARIQPKSIFTKFILIKNKGESSPGCSRSSGSSLRLHPYTNRTACKGNRINNKEEIIYNISKANFIF